MILRGLSDDEYFSRNEISHHDLLTMDAHGPRYLQDQIKERAEVSGKEVASPHPGTMAHIAVLESLAKFKGLYPVTPGTYTRRHPATKKKAAWSETKPWSANAKECRAYLDRCDARGLCPISGDQRENIMAMWRRAQECQRLQDALKVSDKEVAIVLQAGQACDAPLRGKLDMLARDFSFAGDYKTCGSFDMFKRSFFRHGYHRQAAFYQMLVMIETGIKPDWFWEVQENEKPHRIRRYYATEEVLRRGHDENEKALETIEALYATHGLWPLDIDPGPHEIDLAPWDRRRLENEADEEEMSDAGL